MKINRVNKLIEKMNEQNLDQMLVTSPADLFYLTGKWFHPGERMIALYINVTGNHKLIVNKLFPIYEDLGVEILWYSDVENPIALLGSVVNKNKTLGVDKNWPSHFLIKLMENNIGKAFVNSSVILDRIRMIKDEEEINLMRKSSELNDKVMLDLWNVLEEGKSEKYFANLLTEIYEKHGVHELSFEPIIATSPNGADPHHGTGNDTLKKGQSIVLDIGGIYNSYCSDMTRTVFFGAEPSERHAKIYNIVKNANLKGIEAVKPGAKFSDVDKAARNYIENEGYGEFFTHRTGHSIGIETHDFGDVSSINDDELKPGMIFSIEPGIYLKDDIGVRIEDLVLVTKDGCEVLNKVSKEIIVL